MWAGEKVLALVTAAWAPASAFLPSWKGREVISMQTEDLSSNLKEEGDAAFTEMNSADTKRNKKNLNYTRIQKAGIVMSLQWMSKAWEY